MTPTAATAAKDARTSFDVEKVRRRLAPAALRTVLDFGFCADNYRWIDLELIGYLAEKRPDWIVPLKAGFKQENYLGMNATDYGGGTPVVDVWRRDLGLGVGHVELSAKLVSMPGAG